MSSNKSDSKSSSAATTTTTSSSSTRSTKRSTSAGDVASDAPANKRANTANPSTTAAAAAAAAAPPAAAAAAVAPPSSSSSSSSVASGGSAGVERDADGTLRMSPCYSNLVNGMLTDFYQITMAYAYWKNDKWREPAVFDLFFRKAPFGGEFTIFAGLEEALRFVTQFRFSAGDIADLRATAPSMDDAFFEYLGSVDTHDVTVHAIAEGTVVFPRTPLLRLEGPLGTLQLLETTLLTLVNFPSLVATNAARHRMAAGEDRQLLEFGLRRAQGPDGGVTASRYCYMGGFDATSNVLASARFGLPIKGTHAHSFVSSFAVAGGSTVDVHAAPAMLVDRAGRKQHDLHALALAARAELTAPGIAPHDGELAAFVAYARSFPHGFLALVDTFQTLRSGVPNFLAVALALIRLGYEPVGVRLDSGDLAYLSRETRAMFRTAAKKTGLPQIEKFRIVASNDINEATILSLNAQGHEIDTFGIGTNLVTCQAQPALGCVYKLVKIGDIPRIKISHELSKVTLPGKKDVYRLYSKSGVPVVDVMTNHDNADEAPAVGESILCMHPFDRTKRAYVTPSRIEPLLRCYVRNGTLQQELPTLEEIRQRIRQQLAFMRPDHLRLLNPTPYKVSLSQGLFNLVNDIWLREVPIPDLGEEEK